MSFAIFREPTLRQLVRDFARSDDLVALVGAGASVQSGLPSWRQLVEKALCRAAVQGGLLIDEGAIPAWVAETVGRDSLLGAMATAEAAIKEPVRQWLPEVLYGRDGASAYQPGPISRQLASMSAAFRRNLDIATTNYDDLLVVALRNHPGVSLPVFPFTGGRLRRRPHVRVTHLHGLYDRTGHQGDTILTQEQYHRAQRGGSWQEAYIGEKMLARDCLFIGMSMTDSNILRYLDFYSGPDKHHAALIVRQGERSASPALQAAHEIATAARWERKGVRATFLDHFADVAYVLHEIAYCRGLYDAGADYQSLDERCNRWIGSIERKLIKPKNPAKFRDGQEALGSVLRDTLGAALGAVEESGVDVQHDKLAMSLWLLSRDGTKLTCWSSTDRLQYDPETIVPVPLDAASKWIAVSAMCQGRQVVGTPVTSTSRWRYVVGLPLDVNPDGEGTLPVGCLTITSMRPAGRTLLTSMPDDVKAEVHRTVRKALAAFLMEVSGTKA
jgi:NAD-dependent SIR2 family protein deacetylase